jgi:hypothetical protein
MCRAIEITRGVSAREVIRKLDVNALSFREDNWRIVILCGGIFGVIENDMIAKIMIEEQDLSRAASMRKHMKSQD